MPLRTFLRVVVSLIDISRVTFGGIFGGAFRGAFRAFKRYVLSVYKVVSKGTKRIMHPNLKNYFGGLVSSYCRLSSAIVSRPPQEAAPKSAPRILRTRSTNTFVGLGLYDLRNKFTILNHRYLKF